MRTRETLVGLVAVVLGLGGCGVWSESDGTELVGDTPDDGPGLAGDCPPYAGGGLVCEGSFEVRNVYDLQAIATCSRVTGDVDIGANGLSVVEIPVLERVDGDVILRGGIDLQRVSLPDLKEIGRKLAYDFPEPTPLAEIDLPLLRSVGAEVVLPSEGAQVSSVSLACLSDVQDLYATGIAVDAPSLASVPGDVVAGISAPALTDVGGLFHYEQGTSVPLLARAGSLSLGDTDAISLPSLATVTTSAILGCADPYSPSPVVTAATLELPALTSAGALLVCPWPALTGVALPDLQQITGPAGLGGLSLPAGSGAVDLSSLASTIGAATFGVPVSLPALTSADILNIEAAVDAPALTFARRVVVDAPLSAPALSYIEGQLTGTQDLVDLPALARVGGILSDHAVSLPALVTIDLRLSLRGKFGAVYLPVLRRVGQSVNIRRIDGADPFALTSLESVGTDLDARIGTAIVDLPALTSVGGRFDVGTTGTELHAPSLASIGGSLSVNRMHALTTLDLAGLTTVGGDLDVASNDALVELSLPQLTTVGGRVQVSENSGTTFAAVRLAALTSVGGNFLVQSNRHLTTVDVGAASSIGGALYIWFNSRLNLIDFASLTSLGPSLTIAYNGSLPECQATNLRDQLLAAGWTGGVGIYSNGTGTCP